MKTTLQKEGAVLVDNCQVARSFFSRFLGLMGRKSLSANEALVFPKCNSIHTFFMRMTIDVVFVSNEGKVIRVLAGLKPWKMLLPVRGAAHTIEMASEQTTKKNIRLGDRLACPGVFE